MRVTNERDVSDREALPVVGVPEPFERFYAREYRSVLALAYGLSGSRSGVEDLTQESFAAAFREWDRIGRYVDPGAWVRRVLVNRSVSAWRRRVSELRTVLRLGGDARARPVDLDPAVDEVWAEVRRLPKRQAQVVALMYVEDRSTEDIATILGCSTGAVKQHLFRARKRLAVRLGEDGGVR